MSMFIGESLAGDGNEVAHIDLLINNWEKLCIDAPGYQRKDENVNGRTTRMKTIMEE